MNIKNTRPFLVGAVVLCSLLTAAKLAPKPQLALSTVSVTLSNSRLSFKGGLASGNNAGSSVVFINTTAGAYPSTSATQLLQGDSVLIGAGGTMNNFTVASTSANNLVYITSTLGATNFAANSDVVASQSTNLTVRFNTANALNGGRFRILVPADSSSNRSADGIPDVGLFDGGYTALATSSAATVTCPTNTTNFNFVGSATYNNGTATRSATTVGGTTYHSFECWYWGTGGVGTTLVATISGLINPAPVSTHTIGVADTPRVIVQHLNNQFQVIDQTTVAVGLIEAVKITASVAPQITFKILGVPSGTSSICDNGAATTNVSTEPTLVPFGDLLISSFTLAAQTLTVSTNAANGYAVTAKENDQLARNNVTCTGDGSSVTDCLVDSAGDTSAMTYTTPDRWSSTSTKGFAYTVHNNNNVPGMSFPFEKSSSGIGGCNGNGFCYKRFADAQQSQAPQTIFSAATPVDNNNALVCYKAIVSSTQASGEYSNYVTYTATATF